MVKRLGFAMLVLGGCTMLGLALGAMLQRADAAVDRTETAGGLTTEQCKAIPVTTGTPYTANAALSPAITFTNVTRAPAYTGIAQAWRLNFGETQSAEFDITPFQAAPATAFVANTLPAISTADALLMEAPIALTANKTILGTNGTVYGSGQQAIPIDLKGQTSLTVVVTTTGTPTFGASAPQPQLCIKVLQD